jgi:hypothetical protein
VPLRGGDVREPGCFCVLLANCGALHGREAAPAEACFGVACTRTLAPSCAHRLASQRQEKHTVLSKPSTPRGSRRWLHSASAVRAGRTKSHGKSSSCSPVATQMAIKARFHAVAVLVEPWIYSHIIKVDPYYQGHPMHRPSGPACRGEARRPVFVVSRHSDRSCPEVFTFLVSTYVPSPFVL